MSLTLSGSTKYILVKPNHLLTSGHTSYFHSSVSFVMLFCLHNFSPTSPSSSRLIQQSSWHLHLSNFYLRLNILKINIWPLTQTFSSSVFLFSLESATSYESQNLKSYLWLFSLPHISYPSSKFWGIYLKSICYHHSLCHYLLSPEKLQSSPILFLS